MEHKGTKPLETARLILRPFRLEDAESCVRNWAADPEIYRYISQQAQTAQEVQEVQDWLSTAGEAYASPETYYWAIVHKVSGEVIGEIFVDEFSSRSAWCELDWKIGRAFQRKGCAAEAAAAVVRYLFEEVGFHRVQAKCCAENPASERVMQKIGMTKEGVLRGYFRAKDGRWCDVVLYAALRNDSTPGFVPNPV